MEEKNKNLHLRKAAFQDLGIIIEMLADDVLGQTREELTDPIQEYYINAFHAIDKDPNQDLVVLVDEQENVLETLQITYLQYLNHKGSQRALIESVRIHSSQRGKGLGEKMFQLAIERAKEHGVAIIQLTSDKKHTEALKFYEKLGFIASHEGFKMKI
ncbi:GNAT family acetyltransferase [Chryseobacterium piperi]|uniref:GNAT family acetyltransferase n=1 Tax=Chryseobacterium piperi TaxID=558152 RepID=A0A086BIE9_9FLAO|nr:GNAT family N-acetyltransferase [Chryseobacterium piperi]ASW73030.1 N-acetyltransferase [Chryseobacterium piperi]KFF28713.1 GNAT family acetyltransferase [Chryseobacterium piperi]